MKKMLKTALALCIFAAAGLAHALAITFDGQPTGAATTFDDNGFHFVVTLSHLSAGRGEPS